MIKGLESVTYFTSNAKKLANFYSTKVGLKFNVEAELGDQSEKIFGYETKKSTGFYIVDHSKIKGKNKQPARMIVNFEVDNIEKEVKKLGKNGVKKVQDIYHVQDYGYIATFEDLDGNYFQLVKTSPS